MNNGAIYLNIKEMLSHGDNAVLCYCTDSKVGNISELKKELLCPNDARFAQAADNGFPLVIGENAQALVYEPFFPSERLIVLGGGHIALVLVEFAATCGFSVVVADDRPSFANRARFPLAADVICESFEKVFDKLGIRKNDYVVVITRGHRHDRVCMERILGDDMPFYLGMIGSRRRVAALKMELIESGFNAERVKEVHAPIGLSIGAVTPPEIAVSIMAELISCKRQTGEGKAPRSAVSRSDIDREVLDALANSNGEPKAIVTVISAKGSVPRGPGAKMLVYADGRILGSIGGGCSEAEVITIARGIIGSKRFCLHDIDLTAEMAEADGMVCGGVMTVLIEDWC